MHPWDEFPKIREFLADIDMLTDVLTTPDSFIRETAVHRRAAQGIMSMFLPFSLMLMLTDGMLRWYYKGGKGVSFPTRDRFGREMLP